MVGFKAEIDIDGNVMGPATEGMLAWIGTLVDEMGWAPTLVEGQVCRGGVRRQSAGQG